MRKLILSLAALGFVAAPLGAQTTVDDVDSESVSPAPIIGFALAAVALGIFVASDDNEEDVDDDEPVSP